MPEVRLIDANALYREVKTECNPYGKPTIGFDDGKKVLKLIDAAPTIEAEPVRHGRWIPEHGEPDWYRCSCCMKNTIYSTDLQNMETFEAFCSRCGARMDGGADNEEENSH